MTDHRRDDADDDGSFEGRRGRRRPTDFDCPTCAANNPVDDGFGDGDELLCHYCGQEFLVAMDGDGRIRLKEI